MPLIENKYITRPGPQGDGLTLCDGQHYIIQNCIIDLTACAMHEIDEALGVTWGCSANVFNCVFRGAGKLVLCGSGDEDKKAIEKDKTVVFENCIFENFSRRGPEVQDGMKAILKNCLISNWGKDSRFNVRSFGAWAHGEGSSIYAENCVFLQDHFKNGHFWKDLIAHIGQAYNDEGILGLFSKSAWMPGQCRGLVSSDGGSVKATNCFKSQWWVSVENMDGSMDKEDAVALIADLLHMECELDRYFKSVFPKHNDE